MAEINGKPTGSPFTGVILIGLIVLLAIGFFQTGNGLFGVGTGEGPLATGSESDEIRNPQPAGGGGLFGFLFGGGGGGSGGATGARQDISLGRGAPSPVPAGTPPGGGFQPGISPHQGQIAIATVQRSEQANNEYVVIRRSSVRSGTGAPPIDVTGWRLRGRDAGGTIGRAYDIPEIDATQHDIFLPPGGEVTVLTGTPAYQRNFRENRCVGYFTQSYDFRPALTASCPDDNPSRSALLNRGFSGQCIDFIQHISACRTPSLGFEQSGFGLACTEYIAENFNYMGCVANFRDEPNFLINRWRVFLGSSRILFDPRHDIVELRDHNGLLVDTFEY